MSQHLRIQREGFEKSSFCVLSEKIDCDVVNASTYSEFYGIPVAGLGFVFYLAIAGMALFSLIFHKGERRPTAAVMWFLSIAGIFYSAYLAYIATFVLGVVCIECLTLYAVNIALVILLFFAMGVPIGGVVQFVIDYVKAAFKRPSNLSFKPHIIRHAILLAVVFGIGLFAIRTVDAKFGREPSDVTADEKVKAFYMQSLYSIEPDPAWPVWGNPNAKVTIVEFSEFQCPFCRLSAMNVRPYLQEFRGDVRYYFVNFPLDNACNSEMDHPMHQYACLAAEAGICANKRGDFWKFHDELFKKQRNLGPELIYELAEKRGWNREEFEACINSPETEAQVKKDIAVGRKIYINGTPSVFLNDRKLRYWRDSDFLQDVVKEEIEKANK
jgi:protein-disulfide isomerase/uncharacterized membrane protein